jgi:membrane-bound lytic murein transglycosylase D
LYRFHKSNAGTLPQQSELKKVRIQDTMKLPKSAVRVICCVSVLTLTLGGCSKNEVKNGPNITDKGQSELTAQGRWSRKKDSRGSQYDTLWDRLFALYSLPPIENSDIDRELRWFANHPDYIERAQSRAEPFLYSIVKLIEKQEVPGEIALLPIVESAFQPHVVSPARAAGIWQFIPSTGHNYGLKRSRSYDGRRDVYASTKAAIKYLKKLHRDFGDWLLAIAAYNCGEGAVGRAIRRNEASGLPTDFWSLNLPQETRAYVPKLLAVSRLFADSERYGINLRDMPNSAKFKPVKVSSQLDLALAAEAAGISLDKLHELNPGFHGQFADVEGSYHIYIPADKKAAEFRQEVDRLSMERRLFTRPDPLQDALEPEPGSFESFRREKTGRMKADSGSAADADGNSRASAVEVESPVAARPNRLAARVPVPDREAEPRFPVRGDTAPRKGLNSDDDYQDRTARVGARPDARLTKQASRSARPVSYSVQKGDTLYSIARENAVELSELAKWNHIPVNTQVRSGQKLMLSGSEVEDTPEPISSHHSSKASRHQERGDREEPARRIQAVTSASTKHHARQVADEPRKVSASAPRKSENKVRVTEKSRDHHPTSKSQGKESKSRKH